MKKRSLVLAALAPLVAISGVNAVADEMEAKEMRVWSAVLSEPGAEAPGMALNITASHAAGGSNRMAIESVALVSTEVSEDEEGNMTETMSSVECAGPGMVEAGAFMIEAAPMEEAMEEEAEMAEGEEAMEEEEAEMAEAEMAEEEGCSFGISGMASHRYRGWHSWDLSGSVTVGGESMDFDISSPSAAMIKEPEPMEEEVMEEESMEEESMEEESMEEESMEEEAEEESESA